MKIKKILAGLILLSCVNGYGDGKEDLAKKFCPSLQLHSGDQGMSNADLLHMNTNPAFSLKSDEEGRLEEKSKKGRIYGTLIGIGIGGGLGYILYFAAGLSNLGNDPIGEPPSSLIIIPAVVGGFLGYKVGNYFDKKPKKGGEKNEN
ncbi:MAG: hypothetical protein AB1630_06415 [bacterium]